MRIAAWRAPPNARMHVPASRGVLGCCAVLRWGGPLTPLSAFAPCARHQAGRGSIDNFIIGIAFAVASGIVVGVSVTGGGVNSLVGVAISASLLPPVVNIGMCLAYSIVGLCVLDCPHRARVRRRRAMPLQGVCHLEVSPLHTAGGAPCALCPVPQLPRRRVVCRRTPHVQL